MKILVDGPDLTGKTTLTSELASSLSRRGYNVRLAQGALTNNAILRFLARWDANAHNRSAMLNAGYLAAGLFESLISARASEGQVTICESYVDRAIAYGLTMDFGLAPRIALRVKNIFASFDLAILLDCHHSIRAARMIARKQASSIDRLTTENADIDLRFRQYFRLVFARHRRSLILDTGRATPRELAEIVMRSLKVLDNSG